jgi:hypothetical protein
MDKIYHRKYSLDQLRRLVAGGIFAIPELQREFVWSPRKACLLLDSIYKNYPVGALMIWKTSRRNEGQLRKKLHILPHFDSANNKEIYFLIDGQQRLSVLWNVLRNEAITVKNASGRDLDFSRIYFDTKAEEGTSPFLYRQRLQGDWRKDLVPVVDLLATRWKRRMARFGKRVRARAAECRKRILRYELQLILCETRDLAEVRETFIRINSAGMKISTADRAFARASKFDLRGIVKELQARLQNGFSDLSDQTILQTIALANGQRDLGERAIDAFINRMEKNGELDQFNRNWLRLRNAFLYAADYFVSPGSGFGVANFGFVPSEPMVSILTLYFYHNGCRRPPEAAKKRLRRWFWATAVGARYTGRGYRPNILADAAFVERLAASPGAKPGIRVQVPRYRLRSTEYGRQGPLSNVFLCLLRLQRPRYLEDGAEIPLAEISSRSNRNEKHHVFPRALLTSHGIGPERYNCLLNICYLVARENQSVGKKAPRHYLEAVPYSQRARNLATRSHLIPSDNETGVWDRSVRRGFAHFMDQRTKLIVRALEHQAGMPLFERRQS